MYLLRFVRRYIRKNVHFIDQDTGVKIHKRLSYVYVFFAWNAFIGLIYLTKKGEADFALNSGLKTEAEANQSKAISTLEMLGIDKAKVITMQGLKVVKEEDYESYDYKKSKEQKKSKEINE